MQNQMELSAEEFAALPRNSHDAFIVLLDILLPRLRKQLGDVKSHGGVTQTANTRSVKLSFLKLIRSFLKAHHELEIQISNKLFDIKSEAFDEYFEKFEEDLQNFVIEYKFIRHRDGSMDYVTGFFIESDCRDKINDLINQIERVVNKENLPVDKRDAIHKALYVLRLEVNRTRTQSSIVKDRWLDLVAVVDVSVKKVMPLEKLFKK